MKFSLEIPLASMDKNGIIIWAKHKEICIGNTTLSGADEVWCLND